MGKPTLEMAVSRFCSMAYAFCLDKQLDVDFAEGCFLEGDGQGSVDQHGFFGDDVLGPGFDRVFGEVFFGVREGECFRLRVVKDEGDLQSTFHSDELLSIIWKKDLLFYRVQ